MNLPESNSPAAPETDASDLPATELPVEPAEPNPSSQGCEAPGKPMKHADQRLQVVQRRARPQDLAISTGLLVVIIGVTVAVTRLLNLEQQPEKALLAGGVALFAHLAGFLVLLKPVNALNFVGLVYLSMLVRMGLGLGCILFMRQTGTPLFGDDTVGYILAFYGIGLLMETILVARYLKFMDSQRN